MCVCVCVCIIYILQRCWGVLHSATDDASLWNGVYITIYLSKLEHSIDRLQTKMLSLLGRQKNNDLRSRDVVLDTRNE